MIEVHLFLISLFCMAVLVRLVYYRRAKWLKREKEEQELDHARLDLRLASEKERWNSSVE